MRHFDPEGGGGGEGSSGVSASYDNEDYENEPPLLEELGIRFDHIWTKTQAVLYLNKVIFSPILPPFSLSYNYSNLARFR